MQAASMTAATPSQSSASGRLYWICQIAGWGGYAVAKIWAAVFYLHLPWLPVITEALLLHGAALGLTHLLRGFVKRRHWSSLPGAGSRCASSSPGSCSACRLVLPPSSRRSPRCRIPVSSAQAAVGPAVILLLHTINWAFVFMIWLVLYFGALALRQYRSAELRQSELARALQLAELRLLKSQLNPHFLFNALNTVRSLIADDPPRAQDAVTRLANTLRYTLTSAQEELVTLEQELEIVAGLSRARVAAFRGSIAHRLRGHRRRAPRPHTGHAAADRGRERHQARNRRPAGGRRAQDRRRPAGRHADARSREPAPDDALRAKRSKASGCATPRSGCACCSARVPASTSICPGRRWPRSRIRIPAGA